jgi:hypothetical protein
MMTAFSNSSEEENMQAKPPRAEAAAASRAISAACGFRRRYESMGDMIWTEW